MAGDLFIENIGYDQFQTLQAAGGVIEQHIYHADRPWHTNEGTLRDRLAAGPPSNRVHLPAHAYVRFNGGNPATGQYANNPIHKAKLGNFLEKVSRPLGLIAANPNLNGWNAAVGMGRVDLLVAALALGNVVIEYYKYDGSPVLNVQKDWAKHDE